MKRIAYIGCIGVLGIITTEFGIIGILPQIAAHYHITIEKAGTLLSAFSIIIALLGPILTLAVASYNKKKLMFVAMTLFFVSALGSAFAPPFWGLMILRILPAFLQPVYIATAVTMAMAAAKEEKKNQMMGIVFSGIAISTITTIPFATWLAGKYSFQYAYLVGATVSLIAMALTVWGLPNMPAGERKSYGSQLQILKKPTFIVSSAMNLFKISAWFGTYSYFADYLNKAKGMDNVTLSYMLLLFGVTGVIAGFIAGKMLSWSVPKTNALFLTGTIIVPVLLQFSGGNTIATMVVIALWGFLYAPCFLNVTAYMITAAPQAVEFVNSLQISVGNLGVVVGTSVGGWIITTQGIHYTPWVTMTFGMLAFSMMLVREVMERKQATAGALNPAIRTCHS